MIEFGRFARAALGGIVALLIAAPSATAQEEKQTTTKKQTTAQASKRPVAEKKQYQLVLQVNANDPDSAFGSIRAHRYGRSLHQRTWSRPISVNIGWE